MHCLKFLLHSLGEYAQKAKVAAIKMRPVSHVQAAKKCVCVLGMVGQFVYGFALIDNALCEDKAQAC